jgi:uncharacterized protein YndB with AHSA1/START domain
MLGGTMTGLVATAEVEVAADADRVWEALTDPELVAQYMMGSRVESDYRPGSPITWSGTWEGRSYQDKGEVIEAEPGRVLEVTHYSPLGGDDDVPENYHRVRYELEPDGSRTRVRLTQDGCDSPEQVEQFSRTWQAMLDGLRTVAEQD